MPDSPLDGVRSPLGPKPGGGPAPAFSPTSLYSSGSQGIWLDPSDLTTMFSDRAGTTPVTTPGTVVGLRLDKSKGLALGSELVVNGTFDSGITGWSNASAGSAVVTPEGTAILTTPAGDGSSGIRQVITTVIGKMYKISWDVLAYSNLGWSVITPGGSTGSRTGLGSFSTLFTAVATSSTITINAVSDGINAETATFDNISVRELPGNHATAPTDAARPIYGVEPKGGRRNLLTWSEDLTNAAWSAEAGAATFTANTSGTLDRITYTGAFGGARQSLVLNTGVTYTISFDCRRISGSNPLAVQVASSNATYAGFNPDSTLTRYALTFTATVSSLAVIIAQDRIGGAGLGSVEIGNIQLELGSTATNYQRVLSAYDITESGVATCHYVQYDGSDDSMSTAAIDFTATDKMSVFAGVRKLSDAFSVFVELGPVVNSTNGSFWLGPYTGMGFGSRGSVYADALFSPVTTPSSSVLTGLGDISGDRATLRINGAQAAQTTTDQGTGNYGSQPLYLGRRANAVSPLNGRDYGIIIVGKTASAGEISDTETWLAARTSGVSI